MSYWKFFAQILEIFVTSCGWILTIIPPVFVYLICQAISRYFHINFYLVAIICFGSIQVFIFIFSLKNHYDEFLSKEKALLAREEKKIKTELTTQEKDLERRQRELELNCNQRLNELESAYTHRTKELESVFAQRTKLLNREIEGKRRELEADYLKKNKILNQLNKEIESKESKLLYLLNSSTPFAECATMIRDVEMAVFSKSIKYLQTKHNPAPVAAEEVKNMKKVSSDILCKYKEMLYKYEYLLSVFPEIQPYINDDEDLIAVSENISHRELLETHDRRLDYLSKEEYAKLSESAKSQLALDRYVAKKKDKKQIGRDYEMSCAFQLVQKGYTVEMHGIKYGLSDLGRDLIAQRELGGLFGKEILVIQCKNWNKDMTIRENIIMQLYGSTVAYAIDYNKDINVDITPILMIPPYTVISETAMLFANKLNVKIIRMENSEFPRIKCNINHGEKIYHLPFDQLYDRTEIKNKDEFYAYTVEEAESKGFRRAQRHSFSD